jgi:hypothetical protein
MHRSFSASAATFVAPVAPVLALATAELDKDECTAASIHSSGATTIDSSAPRAAVTIMTAVAVGSAMLVISLACMQVPVTCASNHSKLPLLSVLLDTIFSHEGYVLGEG